MPPTECDTFNDVWGEGDFPTLEQSRIAYPFWNRRIACNQSEEKQLAVLWAMLESHPKRWSSHYWSRDYKSRAFPCRTDDVAECWVRSSSRTWRRCWSATISVCPQAVSPSTCYSWHLTQFQRDHLIRKFRDISVGWGDTRQGRTQRTTRRDESQRFIACSSHPKISIHFHLKLHPLIKFTRGSNYPSIHRGIGAKTNSSGGCEEGNNFEIREAERKSTQHKNPIKFYHKRIFLLYTKLFFSLCSLNKEETVFWLKLRRDQKSDWAQWETSTESNSGNIFLLSFASENKFVFSFSPAIFNLECVLLLPERFGMFTQKGKTREKESHSLPDTHTIAGPCWYSVENIRIFQVKLLVFRLTLPLCVCAAFNIFISSQWRNSIQREILEIFASEQHPVEENSSNVWLNVSFSFGKRWRGKETTRFPPTVSCLERKNQQIVMSKQGKHQEGNRTGRSTESCLDTTNNPRMLSNVFVIARCKECWIVLPPTKGIFTMVVKSAEEWRSKQAREVTEAMLLSFNIGRIYKLRQCCSTAGRNLMWKLSKLWRWKL